MGSRHIPGSVKSAKAPYYPASRIGKGPLPKVRSRCLTVAASRPDSEQTLHNPPALGGKANEAAPFYLRERGGLTSHLPVNSVAELAVDSARSPPLVSVCATTKTIGFMSSVLNSL